MTLPLLADPPLTPDPPHLPPAPGRQIPPPWPITPAAPGHHATCPTCFGPVGSLLAGCPKPECLRADLDYDARFDNQDW